MTVLHFRGYLVSRKYLPREHCENKLFAKLYTFTVPSNRLFTVSSLCSFLVTVSLFVPLPYFVANGAFTHFIAVTCTFNLSVP